MLLIGGETRSQERDVVVDRLGQVTRLPKLLHRGRAVALGQLAAVGTEQERQVGVDGRLRPERLEHQQLLGRVGEVVLAADDVGDPGIEVVDGHREVVDRSTVGAGDDGVVLVGVGKRDLAADRRRAHHHRVAVVGDAQADGAVRPLGLAAEAALGAVALLERLDVLGGGVRGAVGVPVGEQLGQRPPAWRSERSVWKIGPSSQSRFSQRRASRICSTFSGVERSRSVSSMRRTSVPARPSGSSPGRARAASCTARSGRRRCGAPRSGTGRKAEHRMDTVNGC